MKENPEVKTKLDVPFDPGDEVFVRNAPYEMDSIGYWPGKITGYWFANDKLIYLLVHCTDIHLSREPKVSPSRVFKNLEMLKAEAIKELKESIAAKEKSLELYKGYLEEVENWK